MTDTLREVSESSSTDCSWFLCSRASRWNDTKIFSDLADEDEDSDVDYMDGESHGRTKASSLLKSKASGLRLAHFGTNLGSLCFWT